MNIMVVKNKYLKDNKMAKKTAKKEKPFRGVKPKTTDSLSALKPVKKTVKKVVKKVLDSTELDEKLVVEYKENKPTYDMILCHVKCYGGYLLAVGAGCTFSVNILVGAGLLIASGIWGWKVNCTCKPCKGGTGSCCK